MQVLHKDDTIQWRENGWKTKADLDILLLIDESWIQIYPYYLSNYLFPKRPQTNKNNKT